jgi:hypothetical protein
LHQLNPLEGKFIGNLKKMNISINHLPTGMFAVNTCFSDGSYGTVKIILLVAE